MKFERQFTSFSEQNDPVQKTAANDKKFSTQNKEGLAGARVLGKTASELAIYEERNRDNYLEMVGIYEDIKKLAESHSVDSKKDEFSHEFPAYVKAQMGILAKRLLKIPMNSSADPMAVISEFESVIRNKTYDDRIAYFAELAVNAETLAEKHKRNAAQSALPPDYKGDDDGPTTVFNEEIGSRF